jgi:cation:H+ antiporter
MLNIILLLVGFIMLIKGADIFVESSSSIAKKFKIPSIIIGMTIVAMGTSAPELSVSINSAMNGMADLSIANVVGSNIFNVLVGLGICSMIHKLKISNYQDVITLLSVSTILVILSMDISLGMLNGLLLLGVFTIYIINMIKKAKANKVEEEVENKKPLWLTIILGLLGLVGIVWGGDLVVDSASAIAMAFGMSENLVGLTIVAVGTSLPEFVTSLMATKKGEVDIAVGNIIGSNVFNILLILGVSSVLNPLTVSFITYLDMLFMLVTTLIFAVATFKNKEVNKTLGIPMTISYVIYIIITIIR